MNTLQNKALRQLGIQQWQRRDMPITPTDSSQSILPYLVTIQWRSKPVGMCAADQDADRTLLEAMLNATRCQWEETDTYTSELPFTVIFGLELAQLLAPELDPSHDDLNITQNTLSGSLIITHSVNEITQNPALKKDVWASLQTAMKVWHAR